MNGYNGWSNYETWNVVLWLRNDEALYDAWRWHGTRGESYTALVRFLASRGITKTLDGVSYSSKKLNRREISQAMADERE